MTRSESGEQRTRSRRVMLGQMVDQRLIVGHCRIVGAGYVRVVVARVEPDDTGEDELACPRAPAPRWR